MEPLYSAEIVPKGKAIKTAKIVDNIANSKDNPILLIISSDTLFSVHKEYPSHLLGARSYIYKIAP